MQLTLAKPCPEGLQASFALIAQEAFEPRWYAAYILPRHEKKVSEYLPEKSIHTFCPVYKAVRDWNGRRATVEMPLFPGYVFVRIPFTQRARVLECRSVLRFVSCGAKPAPIPDEEMDALRSALQFRDAQPHPFLTKGRRVRVRSGALADLEGTIVRSKGKARFVVAVKWIDRSIAFELDSAELSVM